MSLSVTTPDGRFDAYVAMPARTPAPVVVVIQEIFGITDGIRAIADGLARDGFIAVAPDLFWRFQPHIELSEHSEADWNTALGYYMKLDIEKATDDIVATLDAARALPDANGKAGVMGFCLGGLLTFLTVARGKADAGVEYYGGRTEEFVERGKDISTPLLMHLAGEDEFMSKEAKATIKATLEGNPHVEIHVYAGRNHAFARPGGDHYDAADAEKANARTRAFLAEKLG
ncbi:dienelactone hydrolase family protein [Bacillus sp. NP157]|nr:dienelactone hydrolase family protein [Bacillus sp. NP157]